MTAKAARAVSARKQHVSELLDVVEELGALSLELVTAKAVVKAYDRVRARFLELACAKTAPELGQVVIGDEYVATATACGNQQRVCDVGVVYKALGRAQFMALASFRVDDLKQHMTATQFQRAVREDRIGPRRVTVAVK